MVAALASADERFKIVAALESTGNAHLGEDVGTVAGIGKIGVPITETAVDFDVIIDFSSPTGAMTAVLVALENDAAIVTGTTGLNPEEFEVLMDAANNIGVFTASNFSRGIAALREVATKLARDLPDADIEIVEAHHRMKADSPSGTALLIAEDLAAARNEKLDEIARYGRHGKIGPREDREIGISAVRGGGIIGEHSVILALPYETITIEHRVVSRELFAVGALDVAVFIHDKIGYFEMKDLINQ